MIETTNSISVPEEFLHSFPFPIEQALFFDIETTGLSADVSSLYLIGALYYKEGIFYTRQWFAEAYRQEEALLHAFFQFAANYTYLLHFNGNGFDLPFLQKKISRHGLAYSFDSFTSIDVYRRLRPYRKLFSLTSLKQKAVEDFIGLKRQDKLSGRDLIKIYSLYLQKNLLREHPRREALLKEKFEELSGRCSPETDCVSEKTLLLLHNKEDLTGLLSISRMLTYEALLHLPKKTITAVRQEGCAVFTYQNQWTVPRPVSAVLNGMALSFCGTEAKLSVPLFFGSLKCFFPDYKNYYYLPAEDMAIHKSIARYVAEGCREKAKASNCYQKTDGEFLPCFTKSFENICMDTYRKPPYYIKADTGFWDNPQKIRDYVDHILARLFPAAG